MHKVFEVSAIYVAEESVAYSQLAADAETADDLLARQVLDHLDSLEDTQLAGHIVDLIDEKRIQLALALFNKTQSYWRIQAMSREVVQGGMLTSFMIAEARKDLPVTSYS